MRQLRLAAVRRSKRTNVGAIVAEVALAESGCGERDGHRRCIGTGVVKPVAKLVRFVVGPDGTVVADVGGRLPGRGLWLSAERGAVETACRRRAFARAARAQVRVPADLTECIERQLARRCLDLIALARRAHQAVSGCEKTRSWLADGKAGLVLAAIDGAPSELARMRSLAAGLPVVAVLTGAELGAVFARARTVHAAVAPGRLAGRIRDEAERLAGFRLKSAEPDLSPICTNDPETKH